jgi:ADP-heptose:LPS heptosyltransferase
VPAGILAAVMQQSSPSVLVIRLDAIGDAIALTPLLAALRDRGIPVDLVMRPLNAEVFASRAARNVYVAPFELRSSTRNNIRSIDAFGTGLRGNAYSDVFVATEDPGGYRLARAVGAPQRTGFVNGWGKPFKTFWAGAMLTRRIVRSAGLDPRAPHECEVMWRLGSHLLGEGPIPRDAKQLAPLLLDRSVERGDRIAFQVTDKWERLGIEFAQVVAALKAIAGVRDVHAFAAQSEPAFADRLQDACGIGVERFATLKPWKTAIAEAAVLVAPDSGALHVAGMVGTPTVAVFAPVTDFALQTARWAPWAAPYRVVRAVADWPAEAAQATRVLLGDA